MPVVKTPGPKGAKVDPTRQSISRGKQDGRYHTVTKNLDLTMRLLVMRDGRPPHDQVRTLVDESLSKVQGYLTDDLNRAVHVWSGKVIAMYKYLTLKEMKVDNTFPFPIITISPFSPQNAFSPFPFYIK